MSNRYGQSNFLAIIKETQASPAKFDVIYNFNFVSLIAPKFVKSLSIGSLHSPDALNATSSKSKIFLKQSYLLLTWLYYLTFVEVKNVDSKVLTFSFLPTRKKHYTLTKAPMAHKTNSKEQFLFKFYHLRISFKANLAQASDQASRSHDFALLSLDILKKSFPTLETNTLFLKACKFTIKFSLSNYLNLSKFK